MVFGVRVWVWWWLLLVVMMVVVVVGFGSSGGDECVGSSLVSEGFFSLCLLVRLLNSWAFAGFPWALASS